MQISVSAKKIALDFVMILVIASIYSKNVVSLMYHEVMGLSLTALFLVHLIFNRSFITKVTPRVFSGRTPLFSSRTIPSAAASLEIRRIISSLGETS